MDVANHLRLSQGKEIPVVQQVLRRILEPLGADIRFLHSVGADGRAHCTVDDGDTILENRFKRMLVGFGHIFLTNSRVSTSSVAGISAPWHAFFNYSDLATCGL